MSDYLHLVIDKAAQIQNKLEKFGFPHIDLKFEIGVLPKGTAGSAYPYMKKVTISEDYFREHQTAMLENTVPHEICHHYQVVYYPKAKQAHGPEFRHLMNLLGLDGKTCHSMSLSSGKDKRRVNTVTRFMYETVNTKKIVMVTAQKHKKIMAEPHRWSVRGEKIVFVAEKKLPSRKG